MKMKKTFARTIWAFHFLIVLYIFVAALLAIFGILSKYPMLNSITFFSLLVVIFVQAIYVGCPLTSLEYRFSKEKPRLFTIRLFEKLGIKISRTGVIILRILIFGSIIISYFIYT